MNAVLKILVVITPIASILLDLTTVSASLDFMLVEVIYKMETAVKVIITEL